MKLTSATTVLAIVLTAAPVVSAPLIETLPEKTAWVRHHWTYREFRGDRKSPEATGTITISFVGSKTRDGKPHRRLEIKLTYDGVNGGDGKKQSLIIKALVPEAAFKDKKNNLLKDHNEIWLKVGNAAAKPLKGIRPENQPRWLGRVSGVMAAALTPLKGAAKTKPLKSMQVDFQKGRLKCAGKSIRAERELTNAIDPKQTVKVVVKSSVWTNKGIPHRVARCVLKKEKWRNGKLHNTKQTVFTLSDFGKSAKSALPNVGVDSK